jgi:hypothetical protein
MLSLGDVLRDQVGDHPESKPYASFPDSQSVSQALRPFPQYTGLNEAYPYYANSNYHSLQVTLRRQFSTGFGFLTAYTWSKAISQGDRLLNFGEGLQDQFNRQLERSPANYHIPHVLRVTWLYELPFGQGKRWGSESKVWDAIVGGWTLSAIHQYRSGSPVSIGQSGLSTPDGFGSIRPDVINSNLSVGGAPDDLDFFEGTPYLNPGAFAVTPRTDDGVPLRVGTAPRFLTGVRQPHASSESFRITKRFLLYEDVEFEFGAAMTNPFNRHGRGFVTTNISSADFGKLRINGGGQRVIQLEARIAF